MTEILSAANYDQRFLSYSGTGLPLNMVSPITDEAIENRNTWFGVCIDEYGRIRLIHKLVYGSVELSHEYQYNDDGKLVVADIRSIDDEATRLWFDGDGKLVRQEEIDA